MPSLVNNKNKILLNTKKTEIIIFKTQLINFSKKTNKNPPKYLNFRISGQKLSLPNYTIYFSFVMKNFHSKQT